MENNRMDDMASKIKKRFLEWRDSGRYGVPTVLELSSLTLPSADVDNRFFRHLQFGTAGLRGILGAGINRINEYTVARAATGYARYISSLGDAAKQRGMAISYDSRYRSEEFAKITAAIFLAHGVRVYLADTLRPVPILSFAIRYYDCVGGVMITASHNPKEYNGFKVYGQDGGQLPPQAAELVSAEMDGIEDMPAALAKAGDMADLEKHALYGKLSTKLDEAYTDMLLTMAHNKDAVSHQSDLKIVYTPLHGAGNMPVRRVLDRLGFTQVVVVPEQEMPDPAFSTVAVPNPEFKATLDMAICLAQKEGASLVIATDPDGDRCGLAVKDGEAFRALSGNDIGILLLDYILDTRKRLGILPHKSFVVSTMVSTRLAGSIASHYGVDHYVTLTGFKYIAELIKKLDEYGDAHFQFGFEESFGYLTGRSVRDKDGIVASMLVAEMAAVEAEQGRTLADRLASLRKKYGYAKEKTLAYTLAGKVGLERIASVLRTLRANKAKGFPGLNVVSVCDYLDGEHVVISDEAPPVCDLPPSDVLFYELGGHDFMCIRPSGTEPKLKVYLGFYGESEPECQIKMEQARASIEANLANLLER